MNPFYRCAAIIKFIEDRIYYNLMNNDKRKYKILIALPAILKHLLVFVMPDK